MEKVFSTNKHGITWETPESLARREVAWYRKYGRFPQRISRNRQGMTFVIGDSSWNARNPDLYEIIEPAMSRAMARD